MSKKKGFWSSLFGTDDSSSAGSANMATERLKVIVASENRLNNRLTTDRIEKMKREILEVSINTSTAYRLMMLISTIALKTASMCLR